MDFQVERTRSLDLVPLTKLSIEYKEGRDLCSPGGLDEGGPAEATGTRGPSPLAQRMSPPTTFE